MQPLLITGGGFDRVAEGMPEVQQGTLARLALVAADDRRLDLAGAADDVRERRGRTGEQLIEVRLEPAEQGRIADESVLDHLRQSRAQLARRQRRERARVRDHERRLVKGPDQVLAAGVIDTGLAAD